MPLAFSAGALILAVVVAGVWPALHAVRLNISAVLKQSQGVTARRRGWQQKALVVSQIAVSVALFGVAVLFLTSLHHATEIRPGMDPHKKILALSVGPALHIPPAAWCDQVSERLAALALAGCGGGKAPGGLCGALHASCTLAGDAAADQIKSEFSKKSGGLLTCRAIRAAKRLTCNECVGLAAELLEKHGATQQKTENRSIMTREAGESCRAI